MAIPNYCPRCATSLTTKLDGGRERPACPADSCGFIHYGDFSIGCAGVVVRDGRALLVQRGWNPFKGSWQLPGGYAEHDEPLSLAVEREVLEEAGIEARVRDVIAFRHSLGGSIGGPSTNMYVVFRLEALSGEPVYDGDEIANAGFFTLDEMAALEGLQGLSRWAIEKALGIGDGHGLRPDTMGPGANRPGWQLFGIPHLEM
jgi:ADP-ribose pyrophosphatase YjhB (NUDIX family)